MLSYDMNETDALLTLRILMRYRDPGFRKIPTVPTRSSKKEQASAKKLGEMWNKQGLACEAAARSKSSYSLTQLFSHTRVLVQTQECISSVNSPGEHQISLDHQQTFSPFSCPTSSQLFRGEREGETE